jgi:branched-chain amino acid aminotransferase
VWIDGGLVPADEARVSAFDHGLTVGDGVFETMRTIAGPTGRQVPFAPRRHFDRLEASAKGLGLPAPDRSVLESAVAEVLAAADVEARVRVTYTGGPAPLGSWRGDGPCTLVVAAVPLEPGAASVDVAVVPWVRNERSAVAGLKTTSYAENVVALAWAKERGAAEAILGNTVGELCEGTGSNVVVAVDGRLVTPPLASGCLAGVTRALAIEVCGIEEAVLPVSALASASEAALLSTTRDVQPIRLVDGRELPACPGPLTAAAMDAFAALVARDLDP